MLARVGDLALAVATMKNSVGSSRRLSRPSRSALHLITSSGAQRRVETRCTGQNDLASTITQLRNDRLIALCML